MSILDGGELPDDEPGVKPAAQASILDGGELPDDKQPISASLSDVGRDIDRQRAAEPLSDENVDRMLKEETGRARDPSLGNIAEIQRGTTAKTPDEDNPMTGLSRSFFSNVAALPVAAVKTADALSQRHYRDAAAAGLPAAAGLATAAFPVGRIGLGVGQALTGLGRAGVSAYYGGSPADVAQGLGDAGIGAGVAGHEIGARGGVANEAGQSMKGVADLMDPPSGSWWKAGASWLRDHAPGTPPGPQRASGFNPNEIPTNTFQAAPPQRGGLSPGDRLFTPDQPEPTTFQRGPVGPIGGEPAQFNQPFTRPMAPPDTFSRASLPPLAAEPLRFNQPMQPSPAEPSTFQTGGRMAQSAEPEVFNQPIPRPPVQPNTFQTGPVAALGAEPAAFNAPPVEPPAVNPFGKMNRSRVAPLGAEPAIFNQQASAPAAEVAPKDMPPSSPIPEGIPPATAAQIAPQLKGLTPANLKQLSGILSKPSAVLPEYQPEPNVKPTVSLSQIARLLDKVQRGEMSPEDLRGMEAARLKGGKRLQDLPIGKGFSRPGSQPPIDMDEELWNDAREYGQQGR